MKTATTLAVVLGTLCAVLVCESPAISADVPKLADAQAVDACMRANIPQALQIRQLSLSTTDGNGQNRVLRGRVYATRDKGLLRSMLKLEAPLDMKGAAYLLREARGEADAMYAFLPALNKAKRIVGGSQQSPMFGTDISYADLRQISQAFGGGQVMMEAPQSIDGREVYVLALKPDPAQQSQYSMIRAWVDVKTCVALRADFVADKTVRKRYSASAADLRQSLTHWYAAKSAMEDLVSHSRTELIVEGIVSGDHLANTYFDPSTFYLGG